ncbi:MAG: PKD domain-containing protein, partial [Bacteroidales bacterium]|nr:PKD domain-containing protein [Bacteroidales bacterium]
MWGLSPSDNNNQINNYKAQYGVGNPCAGTEGGGPQAINVVNTGQPFIGYPTYVVVCPDRTVYYDVCWPPTATCFNPYLGQCGASGLSAMFETDAVEVCEGGEIAFTDQSACGITAWNWTFEGGTPATSTEQNPVVAYETAGIFDVELTVSNGSNSATISQAGMITIDALPEVTLESFGEVCIEWEPFELTGGLPEGGEYSGPGVTDGIFDPLAVGLGNFLLRYTYIDEQDCENFAEAEITVTS